MKKSDLDDLAFKFGGMSLTGPVGGEERFETSSSANVGRFDNSLAGKTLVYSCKLQKQFNGMCCREDRICTGSWSFLCKR